MTAKVDPKVEKSAVALQKSAQHLGAWLQVAKIRDDSEYVECAKARAEAKRIYEAAEADRKSFTGPLNKVVKEINARYALVTDPAEKVIARTSALLLDRQAHLKQLELLRAEKEAKAAEKQGATELAEDIRQQAALAKVGPKVEGLSTRRVYSARVVDEKKLPREYWLIDQKKLDALARSLKDDLKVPGVELVTEEVMHGGKDVE